MNAKRMAFPVTVKQGSVVVKIYRVENKGRISYTVAYHAGGKRQLKMFADYAEARAEADSKAITLSRGELDVLELRSTDRLTYVQALEAIRPTGLPLELVAKEYAEAWKVLGGKASLLDAAREYARRNLHNLPVKMVPEAVAEMIACKEKEGASNAYRKVLHGHLGHLAEVFHCPLASLTTPALGDYLRNLEAAPRSKNNVRGTLGAFFKFCKERGWLPRDHEGIELIPKFKEKPTGIEIFTLAELERWLRHARPEMVPFLAIGAFAGLRTAEIERLDWAQVHLADGFIEVKAMNAKTASRRLAPVTPNLAAWLAPLAKEEGRVWPFENTAKQIGWLVADVNAARREAGESAVRWKKNALRHSFISYRVAQIQNVAQVALEAGNSPQMIFKHYRELVRPKEAEAWFNIMPAPGEVAEALHGVKNVVELRKVA